MNDEASDRDDGNVIPFPRPTQTERLFAYFDPVYDQPADVVPIRRGNDATPQLADGQRGA